jgi:hypothetical protein
VVLTVPGTTAASSSFFIIILYGDLERELETPQMALFQMDLKHGLEDGNSGG